MPGPVRNTWARPQVVGHLQRLARSAVLVNLSGVRRTRLLPSALIARRRLNDRAEGSPMYGVLEKTAEVVAVMAVPAAMIAVIAWAFVWGIW